MLNLMVYILIILLLSLKFKKVRYIFILGLVKYLGYLKKVDCYEINVMKYIIK